MERSRKTLALVLSLGLALPASAQVKSVPRLGAAPLLGTAALPTALPALAPSALKPALPAPVLPAVRPLLAAPSLPAAAVAPEGPKTPFAAKVAAVAAGVAEAGKALAEPGADGGHGAAEAVFNKLSGAAVALPADFSAEELAAVKAVSDALEGAVARAAGRVLGGRPLARSRGSSSRLTHADANPDYDVMVRVPEGAAVAENLPALKAALSEAVGAEAARLFPGVETKVSVAGPVQLSDPADHKKVEGVWMLPVVVSGPQGVLADADVTFTARPEYANAYPDHFAAQLAELEGRGVPAGEVLTDIRLAKRFFKTVLGSYKAWQGGPSGVGVEQMVLQAGGRFDAMMERLYDAAYEADGRPRGLKKARRRWTVENRFMAPANFLDLFGEKAWAKTAFAARAYREAKDAGRAPALEDLRQPEAAPAPLPAAPRRRDVPVVAAPSAETVSVQMATAMKQVKAKELARAAVRELKGRGLPVEDSAVSWRRAEGRNLYTVSVRLAPGSDAAAAEALLRRRLAAGDPRAAFSAAAEPALRAPEAWVKVSGRAGAAGAERAAKKLARRLGLGRTEVEARRDGTFDIGFRLGATAAGDFASGVRRFFERPVGVELLSIALPASEPAAADAVGRLTLDMLNRFTTHGPAPAARGDAYLYAQGAKALPEGLEEAGKARARAPLAGAVRTMFYRRNGRAYVMLEDPDAQGMNTMRPVKVPSRLAQGVVTDTLVEVVTRGKAVLDLRPVGSYAADMVIGRVARAPEGPRLMPLFSGDAAKALYETLPLSAAARDGDIVQAFVRPAAGGFEAVPLLSLGAELTPEIAAREIALRHGARGYFERAVIEQAEAVGRSQDPEADFRRMKESRGRAEDLRELPFVTIDPVGAGDLDDAYFIRREADGSYTWYLATADVGAYVKPGTPAFRAAARVGNTFYSPDKDGVGEFPMNHPVVSKAVSSLLAGKDSLAMVTKMRFAADGRFLLEDSEVFLGLVRVQGRYTYDQVAALWRGSADHGVAHLEQVALARELAGRLGRADDARGKLAISLSEVRHAKGPDGRWRPEAVAHDPLESESHRLIEELKVYGNRAIATRLEAVADAARAPHVSRVHPAQEESVDERLRSDLASIGFPWRSDETLHEFLIRLKGDRSVRPEVRETAQVLALMSRSSARYAATDAEGHEGLALKAKSYDHPSTPIRRFSDMYNRALLEAYLEGGDPRAVHEAVLKDLEALGFSGFEEYLEHLNGREQAARRMDREFEAFMAVYELAKPEHRGRTFAGFVKILKQGRNAEAVIQLRELPVTVTLTGDEARRFRLLDEVTVTVRGADPASQSVDARVVKK